MTNSWPNGEGATHSVRLTEKKKKNYNFRLLYLIFSYEMGMARRVGQFFNSMHQYCSFELSSQVQLGRNGRCQRKPRHQDPALVDNSHVAWLAFHQQLEILYFVHIWPLQFYSMTSYNTFTKYIFTSVAWSASEKFPVYTITLSMSGPRWQLWSEIFMISVHVKSALSSSWPIHWLVKRDAWGEKHIIKNCALLPQMRLEAFC